MTLSIVVLRRWMLRERNKMKTEVFFESILTALQYFIVTLFVRCSIVSRVGFSILYGIGRQTFETRTSTAIRDPDAVISADGLPDVSIESSQAEGARGGRLDKIFPKMTRRIWSSHFTFSHQLSTTSSITTVRIIDTTTSFVVETNSNKLVKIRNTQPTTRGTLQYFQTTRRNKNKNNNLERKWDHQQLRQVVSIIAMH